MFTLFASQSRTPKLPKRRLSDPPSAGGVPKRINPWRERTTLPLVEHCTLLSFVEFLDDRGRLERPDKRGRIDPKAPRAVDRLLAQAGTSARRLGSWTSPRSWSRNSSASHDSEAIAAAGTMLDDVESRIRDILVGATGPPPIAWRGTVIGSEAASEREAERRAEPLRPLAARSDAIRT